MSAQPATTASTAAAAPWQERNFDEIQPGDCAVLEKVISSEDISAFAALCGDFNPLHIDERFARTTSFGRPVAHGMLLGSYVSTLIGMQLPGPGALWTEQTFRWLLPVFAGDLVRVTLRVAHKSPATRMLKVQVEASNQDGRKVMEGAGLVLMVKKQTPAGTTD